MHQIPEILPLGSFSWNVRPLESKEKKENQDSLLKYDIQLKGENKYVSKSKNNQPY